ncbi:uncharacterized protein LOC143617214 [Bidens hawaiensis]|uniref:uncharacterized protein LOC143617214 n=1 Tax=Bidens hawaiensis TaxID=980011 RepID=UPI00404B548C
MDVPMHWVKWLPLAEWWYNTTFHLAIKMTPFEALYGYPPPIHIPFIPNDTQVADVETMHKDRELMIQKLKVSLQAARNRMKQYADTNSSERQFKLGDYVYLKLQPYVQSLIRKHKYSKLDPWSIHGY